jgi:hypothetical protein
LYVSISELYGESLFLARRWKVDLNSWGKAK